MDVSEYLKLDATGMAALVARGDVTAAELLDCAMARLDDVNPTLNAVVSNLEPQAREAIAGGLPDGPFAGVPFLLKDVTTQMAGAVTSAGSRVFADAVALEDSALVAAYKRAGLNIFGKASTPEFGLVGVTEPDLFGATLNPWNLDLTCGGSSGGSASAVAGGIVPAAQASDAGGSIRIPASCCGLFGLKPSRGRVSMAPGGEGWAGLTVLHALTRSVRDSAALLDVSCEPQLGDPYWLPKPQTPFADEVGRAPGRLRIGMLTRNLNGNDMAAPCAAGVRAAAALCESLGHDVEELALPPGLEALTPATTQISCASLAVTLEREAERRGRPIGEGEIEPLTRKLYELGKGVSGVQYAMAMQTLHAIARRVAVWRDRYDVVLLSTLGRLPIPIGMLKGEIGDLAELVAKFYDFGPNTQLFNVTGHPAMSVPLAWSEEGVPVGIQFVGRAAGEAELLRLAAQLESAQPWADRRPPELAASTTTARAAILQGETQ
jgi:amidase